jgi:hypothetical protein
MVTALVASNPLTGAPTLAFLSDGKVGRIISADGEVPGSKAALVAMHALYQQANVPLSDELAFELYGTAHGNLAISDPVQLDMEFVPAIDAMRAQLAAAIRQASPERQGRLDQVRRARERLAMDDPSACLANVEGLDEAWKPDVAAEFRAAAGAMAIPYTAEERAERVAFLQDWLSRQELDDEDVADEQ